MVNSIILFSLQGGRQDRYFCYYITKAIKILPLHCSLHPQWSLVPYLTLLWKWRSTLLKIKTVIFICYDYWTASEFNRNGLKYITRRYHSGTLLKICQTDWRKQPRLRSVAYDKQAWGCVWWILEDYRYPQNNQARVKSLFILFIAVGNFRQESQT